MGIIEIPKGVKGQKFIRDINWRLDTSCTVEAEKCLGYQPLEKRHLVGQTDQKKRVREQAGE